MSPPADLASPALDVSPPPYRPQPYRPQLFVAPANAPRRSRLPSFRARELLAVAVVVVGCDTWWWRAGFGGYGGAILGVCLLLAMRIASPARVSWWRALPFELLVGLACLRLAYDPGPLSFALLFGGILALAAARRGASFAVTAVGYSALAAFPALPHRAPALLRGACRVLGLSRLSRPRSVAPLLVPAALATVFAGIFAIANPVVAHTFATVFSFLRERLHLPDPLRLVLLPLATSLAAVLVRPVLRRRASARRLASAATATALSATDTALATSRNTLLVLNVVFAGYVLVDGICAAHVLASGTLPPGVTTQVYAHQGAFWLTVALLLVTVVLGVLFRGPLAVDERARGTRRLAGVWIAQSGLVALGAALRLGYHVYVSGFSDLRFVGALGTALVAVGLGLVGWKIRRRHDFRWLLEHQLGAFVGALALYALVPTHRIAAAYDVPRLVAGDYGPLVHVHALSREPESAAMLLPLLHHDDVRIRAGVAVFLQREEYLLTKNDRDADRLHTSYTRSEATRALTAAAPAIAEEVARTCPDSAESVFRDLVEQTVEGEKAPSLRQLPAAEVTPCYSTRPEY